MPPVGQLAPIDLNCGWDVEAHPIEGGLLYHQNDALKLGVNIITTALANQQYAAPGAPRKSTPVKTTKRGMNWFWPS